jgi:hypothetical protein
LALSRPSLFVAATFVALALPGCLDDTSPRSYHAAGQAGSFVLGWGYDGEGVLPFAGFITIHADPVANTGEALVMGELNGQHWKILFDRFAQQGDKAFQDGGIVANLDEHGDTGHGDASIPKVHADAAAWGDALVTVDGQPVLDPLTGEEGWVAHYMVITTGVRDDQNHGIWNAAKTAPYDSKSPADGLALEGDNEIHLVLKSHATAPPNATAVSNKSQGSANPFVNANHGYANKYQNAEFNVTIKVAGTFAAGQSLNFTLRDPNGKSVRSLQLPRNNQMEGRLVAPLEQVGKYVLSVRGQGLQAGYEITGAITPPSNVVMNFWWEDVLFGQAAEAFEATAGSGNHTDEH